MKFLRTVSTRRLLAMIAGLLIAVVGGTTIAVAASSGGPVPRAKPLASAVHDALASPAVTGISARISFTNHLIASSNIEGSDPILTGASGRLWLTNDHRLRIELQSDNGQDAQVVINHNSFWVSDPMSNTVYEGTLPADTGKQHSSKNEQLPSVNQINAQLGKLAQHLNTSGAIPSDVAGRAAYTVRVSPQHDGGLLGEGQLAWDALRGVPLRFAVYAQHDPNPVLELKVTDISFGSVPTSVFSISRPPGAKVVKVSTPGGSRVNAAEARARKAHKAHTDVTGAAAVARRLPFQLLAPGKLVGLPRRSVTLLDWGGHPAALVAYGQNLGGVAVIEQTATSNTTSRLGTTSGSGDHKRGLTLPSVSINGATGQELDTALGTMVRFTRGGVTYTVLGSVPPAAAEAAARAL